MAQDKNKDQTETRAQIANELRDRSITAQDVNDPLVDRLFNALCAGEGARGLAVEAYRAIADLIEQGPRA